LHWVKGDPNGTAIVKETDLENVCYSLTGTDELFRGVHNPDAHDGLLRVILDWDKRDIDLNLNISGPTEGVKEEHPEYECPRENWYIENDSGLATGDYYVSVTGPSSVDEALMPEQIRVDVKAIGKHKSLSVDINDSMLLSLGEVYRIHISLPEHGTHSSSIATVIVTENATTRYRMDSHGSIYTAEIFLLLRQLALGPIAGATLSLEKLNYGAWQEIYSGVSTSGATLNSNGLILFPSILQESVSESDILLLTASGGQDVDVDDDLNIDATPTTVLGKLHVFIASENIIDKNFKVNILTEIAYQAVHNKVDVNTTQETLFSMLDDVAQLLLKKDKKEDNVTGYKALTSWVASFDKDALLFDYDAKIEPIVQKIYRGEDIYLDVYKLLYAGKVDAFQVENNITENTLCLELNDYVDLSQLQKEDFTLNNRYGKSVKFSFSIVDGKIFINPLSDLVNGATYTLSFELSIYDDQNNMYVDRHLHEFTVLDTISPVILESTIHVNEDHAGELPFHVTDRSMPLTYSIVGGVDSALFEIRKHYPDIDRIYFKEAPNYEHPADSNGDNTYELNISVADSFSNTTTQDIQIIVDNVKEGVLLADTNMTVNENMPVGTYVGSITILDEGDKNPMTFYSQWFMKNFSIDDKGKIFTNEIFDYEKVHNYSFNVYAYNNTNISSNEVDIHIAIKNVPEPLPKVHPFTGSMDDSAPTGKVVGQLYVYPGLDDEAYVQLIGQGADDFDVNTSGHITVSATANLDHTIQNQYDLKAIASNSYGESEEVNVTLYINIWTKQLGGTFGDYPGEIVTDEENNVYLSGEIGATTPQNKSAFINKYNSIGALQWSYDINLSENTRVSSIVVDKNGTVFVTGAKATTRRYVYCDGPCYIYTSWIMALSSQGERLWSKVLDNGALDEDSLGASFIDHDGNIIVSGNTAGAFEGYVNSTGSDLFFTKLSALGEIEWIKQLSISGNSVKVNKEGAFSLWSGYELMIFDPNSENVIWSSEIKNIYTSVNGYPSRLDYALQR